MKLAARRGYSFLYEAFWWVREKLARLFVVAAHKLDSDVAVDIYQAQECERICSQIWAGHFDQPDKSLDRAKIRQAVYAAFY